MFIFSYLRMRVKRKICYRVKIQGKQTTVRFTTHPDFLRVWAVSSTCIISDSGDRIQIRTQFSDGDYRNYNYILE